MKTRNGMLSMTMTIICSPKCIIYTIELPQMICIQMCVDQARQTRPNSGGVAEVHLRFDKGGFQ